MVKVGKEGRQGRTVRGGRWGMRLDLVDYSIRMSKLILESCNKFILSEVNGTNSKFSVTCPRDVSAFFSPRHMTHWGGKVNTSQQLSNVLSSQLKCSGRRAMVETVFSPPKNDTLRSKAWSCLYMPSRYNRAISQELRLFRHSIIAGHRLELA